jgi:hypothetical protein
MRDQRLGLALKRDEQVFAPRRDQGSRDEGAPRP